MGTYSRWMEFTWDLDVQLMNSYLYHNHCIYLRPYCKPIPPIVMAFSTVYSSIPYLLPSLPFPLSLIPPNGAAASLTIPVFTPTIPNSIFSDTLHTFEISLV